MKKSKLMTRKNFYFTLQSFRERTEKDTNESVKFKNWHNFSFNYFHSSAPNNTLSIENC